MTIGSRIRYCREKSNMTLEELAKIVGVSRQTLSRYETGVINTIPSDRIEQIAEALKTTPAYIMGWDVKTTLPDNILPLPRTYDVPLVGTIACGDPILAIEETEETVPVPEHIKADFALRCQGDSMINARIFDSDIVYIRKQPDVESGEIAAILIQDEVTLKRVRKYDDHIALEPANPMYEPLVYWRKDIDKIQILGKAVAFTSTIK